MEARLKAAINEKKISLVVSTKILVRMLSPQHFRDYQHGL
jgi:hypothetical protein